MDIPRETCPICNLRPITAWGARKCDTCHDLCSRCRVKPRALRSYWCLACKAEAMRESRKRNPMTDEQRYKDNARSYANVYLKRGKIERKPCEVCGSDKAQMHHEDYSRPTEVRWFCRKHHLALHKNDPPADRRRDASRISRGPRVPTPAPRLLYSRKWRGSAL